MTWKLINKYQLRFLDPLTSPRFRQCVEKHFPGKFSKAWARKAAPFHGRSLLQEICTQTTFLISAESLKNNKFLSITPIAMAPLAQLGQFPSRALYCLNHHRFEFGLAKIIIKKNLNLPAWNYQQAKILLLQKKWSPWLGCVSAPATLDSSFSMQRRRYLRAKLACRVCQRLWTSYLGVLCWF